MIGSDNEKGRFGENESEKGKKLGVGKGGNESRVEWEGGGGIDG